MDLQYVCVLVTREVKVMKRDGYVNLIEINNIEATILRGYIDTVMDSPTIADQAKQGYALSVATDVIFSLKIIENADKQSVVQNVIDRTMQILEEGNYHYGLPVHRKRD